MPRFFSVSFTRSKAWVLAHKAVSALVAITLIIGTYATVHASSATAATSYVLGAVSKGTVVETVSGSGQVAASNTVEVVAKAAGTITGVQVKVGQEVRVGQQLASIDPGDAGLQLRQAQLAYNELIASKSASGQQAGNSVTQGQQGVETAYATARGSILSQNAALVSALNNVQILLAQNGYLASTDANAFAAPERAAAVRSVQQATADLSGFTKISNQVTDTTDAATLQSILTSGVAAARSVSQAAKDAETELEQIRQQSNYQNNSNESNTAFTTVTSSLTSANTAISNLLSAQQGITNAQNTLAQSQTSAANTTSASSDVLSAQLNVESKQQAYNNFFVTTPISGIVAKIDLQIGDQASSGTTVATVLTKQQIAQVTLNEVDAAKVKVGDKVTLTFDAIDGLTLQGTVAEVDLVGTVTSGVVSYGTKITLDSSDERITSGMTVNADITIDSAEDALVVPSSAVTTLNGKSFVRVIPNSTMKVPATVAAKSVTVRLTPVTLGISDGTRTQILSGLSEGDVIVMRTQSTSAKTTAAAATTRTPGAGPVRASGSAAGGNASFRAF
jgi:HlyD family secretion protein